MAANSRMASAVQILCVLAYKGTGGTTAEVIARSLRTNPVVVRRLLKTMEHAGLVAIRPGKDGGVQLARDPATVTLDEVYRAVETGAGVFALRREANPACPVARTMIHLLPPIFAAANDAVEGTLRGTTIAGLASAIA